MIISRTPYRISFFGGGTDYPAWYREHGGAVLATAIDKYCFITCRYLPPFFEHRTRVVWSRIENCQNVDEIAHPAVREDCGFVALQRGPVVYCAEEADNGPELANLSLPDNAPFRIRFHDTLGAPALAARAWRRTRSAGRGGHPCRRRSRRRPSRPRAA